MNINNNNNKKFFTLTVYLGTPNFSWTISLLTYIELTITQNTGEGMKKLLNHLVSKRLFLTFNGKTLIK